MNASNPVGLILLDGPNGAGKSYLAQKIKERFPTSRYVHCTYRFKACMFTYHLAAMRHALRESNSTLTILDRNWPSEEIYGHFYRSGTAWPHQGRIVQKLMLKHAGLTVLCLLSPERAKEQIALHRQTYHSPQFLTRPADIASRYQALFEGDPNHCSNVTYVDSVISGGGLKTRQDVMSYRIDTDGSDINLFIDRLLARLAAHREAQYQPALQFGVRNVAGHLASAKYLIVGDKVNAPDYSKCWPFMAYKGSTLFVAQAMHALGCREEEFMWTNANCEEPHANLADRGLRVIALGNHAHAKYGGIKVPHPSYSKRFMGSLAASSWLELFRAALQGR